ncbi:MAG: dihydroorotate dehydrogenase-like protein [Proteobacteria bacterium]|nr:dihydroorotate dehydrogenase-like protein [Pseudomonadota bacterium]MBU1542427.1 dihydroorotate dehydrogenase-like protein [Pseudomonadota bacterium]MBU2431363.1 dihydroorotate dehydrogenase-like protein [Pseudomonadota bacterium]MBU2482803.1 dihydroorotate dehydrogenase-like protein [Pseudomonadota bacterium]
MVDLSTEYMGLQLKNPIIAGSSGLTGSVKKIQEIEKMGAGAVVLKSIFEEEIAYEYSDFLEQESKSGPPQKYFDYDGHKNPIDFYDYIIRDDNLKKYKQLIADSKKSISIPVIASINCCYHSVEWISYAKQLEEAGADALELNMFFLPSNFNRSSEEPEKIYFQVIEQILREVSIPVALKISYYFTDLGPMIQKLSNSGIKALVLFNRFFSPDFDIEKLEVKPSFVFSSPSDIAQSLRWIGIMSQRVNCDLAASTGVHDGEGAIKQILAGAKAVQMVSVFYKNKIEYIQAVSDTIKKWMSAHSYNTLQDFRGLLSQPKTNDPAVFERVQFMKYFN